MDFDEAQQNCICPQCPTYRDCDEPVAFCMHDPSKSICIAEERGCLCGDCPVHSANGFIYGYYCTRGSEKELASSG